MAEVVLNQRYRLLEKVGEGGMARVFRAEDLMLGRTVAVKVLREQYAADEAFLTRFRQEARAAAGLTHPNVVSIFDVGVDGEQNYIVMEYVAGPTLKEHIKREAPFSAGRAVEVTLQILAAVGAAHQRGIVHRDLKPQNILMTPEGQAKVADFGIARAASGAQFTETGVVLGTVHYMSPEQAMGQPSVPASDLYAVGVILYEMLAGQLPFDSENALGVALKHVQEEPAPPSQVNPKVPTQLSALVVRALAKDPAARYPAAEQMRLALRSYLEFGDQATSPISPVSPGARRQPTAPPPPRKGKGFDWFMLIAAILIFGFIVGSIPVAIRVYEAYMMPPPGAAQGPGPATPTTDHPRVVGEPSPTPEPSPTSASVPGDQPPATATPGPTVSVTATPSLTVTPTSTPQPKVPKLIGKKKEDAEKDLQKASLKMRVIGEEYSDEHEKDIVVSQTVPEGTQVEPNAVIGVVVSKGKESLTMPNLVGQTESDARDLLRELDLDVSTRMQEDPADSGTVIGQQPAAGENVKKRDPVTLVISRGQPSPTSTPPPPADSVAVPRVIGMSEREARRTVDEVGLTNTYVNYQRLQDVPPDARADFLKIPVGHVVSQQPTAGAYAKKGSTVYLAVRSE